MSEQQQASNIHVLLYMVVLSFVCALILSILASVLKEPQEIAKTLDRSKQLMIAARLFTHKGYFLMRNEKGEYVPAKYAGDGTLVQGSEKDIATGSQILDVYNKRIVPYLVDDKGNVTTFEKDDINEEKYISEYKDSGYYKQPLKLIYAILPNPKKGERGKGTPIGYVIPVNGSGLWGPIYGYLGVEPDGDTVLGTAWYDQGETPGLGADIADAPWQSQFFGKKIFLPSPSDKVDFATAPIGITVVKGKVAEVLGDAPKAETAVDGIPGATLTGNGVTAAYQDVLTAYRPFFIKIHKESEKS